MDTHILHTHTHTHTHTRVCVCVCVCIYRLHSQLSKQKNLPAMQEIQIQSLGQEDPQEKEWQPTPANRYNNN